MDPRKETPYKRLVGFCVYCGGEPTTDDHVPALVFLDESHEKAALVVDACLTCNSGASLDEEFVACLLECVVCGSTDVASLGREKIRRALSHSPKLGEWIARWRSPTLFGRVDWAIAPDQLDRVERVVVKLARGLLALENGSALQGNPKQVSIAPMVTLSSAQRDAFEAQLQPKLWPEVGTRAFVRAVEGLEGWPWAVVQPQRFRYCVHGTEVRMVLREYLACVVAWE